MHEMLLRTKLFIPPLRPNLVSRPQLIERLNQGLELGNKLTLISAPAGFGKTTLVTEWFSSLNAHAAEERQHSPGFAWFSLDEGDNDPARFLAYFVASLQQIGGTDTAIGTGALSMLQSPQPPAVEEVLTALINELVLIPTRLILVLDDYHVVDTAAVDNALAFLLEHLPPQLHLVVATRDDPNLPVTRLRARGQLTELRAAELRFSRGEVAEFLNKIMGLGLAAADIAALETRTEGWIAGLQLAAISMQGHPDASRLIRSFTGSHRFVLDYLIEEVLEQQSEDVQSFLLETAVLDRFTGSLCDAIRFGTTETPDRSNGKGSSKGTAVSGKNSGQATLETLERANLFIVPLDNERRWYRYHHLFAELLRRRLRQTQPDRVLLLHRRASRWYLQHEFTDDAIEHALLSQDTDWAARLVDQHADVTWQRGEQFKLRRWLSALPAELVSANPNLCIAHAWTLFAGGQENAAEQSLQAAEKALANDSGPATSFEQASAVAYDRLNLQGRVATIRAFIAFFRGDVQEIYEHAQHALELLPQHDSIWRSTATVALGDAYSFIGELPTAFQARADAVKASEAAGNTYMTLIASIKLAATMRELGRLEQGVKICRQQLRLAHESGLSRSGVVGWLQAIWGEILAEMGDPDEAYRKVTAGAQLTVRGADIAMFGWSHLCLTRVLFSRGDLAAAAATIQKVEASANRRDVPPWITSLMEAWQARILLAEGKLDAARHWVEQRGLDPEQEPVYLGEKEYISLSRILVATGQFDTAAALLRRLLKATEAGGRVSRMIEVLIAQSLLFDARGERNQAVASLERAVTLAQPGGFVQTFADEGQQVAAILAEVLARGVAPEYVRRLLAAFATDAPAPASSMPSQSEAASLVEPLSEREIEVLQLIAEGLTNREIAARLYLSPHTVKVHTRNIYGKLDIHNRTQAVARARALGLLPPT